MRIAPAVLGIFFILAGSGCLVVGATVAAVGAIAATTVKTAGTVTVATVQTTGRVASAAVTSSGEMTALSMETSAKLARAGMVVVVDATSGTTTVLPWQAGMKLYSATQAGSAGGVFRAAKIFRTGRMITADLRKAEAASQVLQSGDVMELHR